MTSSGFFCHQCGMYFWSLASTLPIIVPADFSVNNGSENCNSSIRIIWMDKFWERQEISTEFWREEWFVSISLYNTNTNKWISGKACRQRDTSLTIQSGEIEKHGYTSWGAKNQEWLCWKTQQEFSQNLKRQTNEDLNSRLCHLNWRFPDNGRQSIVTDYILNLSWIQNLF